MGSLWGKLGKHVVFGIQSKTSKCEQRFNLRGIFLVRKKEIDWFYQYGASNIYPDKWESYLAPIPENKRDNLLSAYYEILTGDDHKKKIEAAKAWSTWEGSSVRLILDDDFISDFGDAKFAEAFARIECHYFMNNCWFPTENYLIENVDKIRHIPAVIVHGRYDIICPVVQAWDLHKAWPEADLHIIPDAGHSIYEEGIKNKLLEYTDKFLKLQFIRNSQLLLLMLQLKKMLSL